MDATDFPFRGNGAALRAMWIGRSIYFGGKMLHCISSHFEAIVEEFNQNLNLAVKVSVSAPL
jgi:L-arabinose isomerase